MISINDHENLKAWPFVEAKKIIKNLGGINNFKAPEKGMYYLKLVMGPQAYPI